MTNWHKRFMELAPVWLNVKKKSTTRRAYSDVRSLGFILGKYNE